MMSQMLNRAGAALLALTVLGGCKSAAEAAAEPMPESGPVAVHAEAATPLSVPRNLRVTGTLRGDREVDLAANASGRVLATLVERGQRVTTGQVIAKLDVRAASLSETEAKAQAQSARAQEEQAKGECERYEKLKQKSAITDLEYLQKMTQCRTLPLSSEAASARAAMAAQNVGDGVIRAPYAGVVAERFIEVGQYVRQDTRVVSLASVDPIRLQLSVPEADVPNVHEGGEVTFLVGAYPERRFVATIRFVSGVVRATTRDLVVEAVISNKDRLLLPGMFADAEIAVGQRTLPSVPKAALFTRDNEPHAFVVIGDRLEERVLALGPELDGRVAISRGIAAGERVVIEGQDALKNGQQVR